MAGCLQPSMPREGNVGIDEPFPDLTHERDTRTPIFFLSTSNFKSRLRYSSAASCTKAKSRALLFFFVAYVVVLDNPYLRWAYPHDGSEFAKETCPAHS